MTNFVATVAMIFHWLGRFRICEVVGTESDACWEYWKKSLNDGSCEAKSGIRWAI
jgi:hypothetical protein